MRTEVKDLIKEGLNEIVTLESVNPKMFNGLNEIVKPLYDYDYWSDILKDINEMVSGDENYEEGEDLSIFGDKIGFEVIRIFGETWYNNLKEMGYKYDGRGWDIDKGITNYGLVWDYWIDLDTSPREICSDILDEIFNEIQPK